MYNHPSSCFHIFVQTSLPLLPYFRTATERQSIQK
jgi:hypothetical protein